MAIKKILLLPRMDGTGKLLLPFSRALPTEIRKVIPVYLTDRFLSYDSLAKLVRSFCEDSEPFVLMAESFSSRLAIRIAAEGPPNLRGVILCVGFAASPVRGVSRWLGWLLSPALMRSALPAAAIRHWLVGPNPPKSLLAEVRDALLSVRGNVLASRLRAVLSCDVRQELNQVSVPMLYLQAKQDRLVKPRCLREIQGIRPGTEVIKVEGPHLLLQREPQKAAQIIAEWLQTLSEGLIFPERRERG